LIKFDTHHRLYVDAPKYVPEGISRSKPNRSTIDILTKNEPYSTHMTLYDDNEVWELQHLNTHAQTHY